VVPNNGFHSGEVLYARGAFVAIDVSSPRAIHSNLKKQLPASAPPTWHLPNPSIEHSGSSPTCFARIMKACVNLGPWDVDKSELVQSLASTHVCYLLHYVFRGLVPSTGHTTPIRGSFQGQRPHTLILNTYFT